LAAGGLAALGILAGVLLRKPAAEPPLPEASLHATPTITLPSPPVTAKAASPSGVVLELPSAVTVAPSASSSARPSAARAQPAASTPRSRASSYGLSEDNPFK
jgi:hypothetical protein